jgi:hypothetical protein
MKRRVAGEQLASYSCATALVSLLSANFDDFSVFTNMLLKFTKLFYCEYILYNKSYHIGIIFLCTADQFLAFPYDT